MYLSPFILLVLLVCGSQASHFYGTVMTFNVRQHMSNGLSTVIIRYKTGFHTCSRSDSWSCASQNCGTESLIVEDVDSESGGDWCHKEGIMTRQVSNFTPFELTLSGCCWISIVNGISSWRALTSVDLRIRSDTQQSNRSPQTTMLPLLRVPSNCPRTFNLLAFDPDGDHVYCRFGNVSAECSPCTLPSVLTIHPQSCTLSFNGTTTSIQGSYAVQLMVEDFPKQPIFLSLQNGTTQTNGPLSKLPLQFVIRVDPAVPSCVAGEFLPRFLPPTPENKALLYAYANQTLEISIYTEATNSMVNELLVSGPHNINKTGPTAGRFLLRWTPSVEEDGEYHPICFVAQALNGTIKYHSEVRCVIVSVGGRAYVLGLSVRLSSAGALTEEHIRNAVLPELKQLLVQEGLPGNITLALKGTELVLSPTTPP